MRWCNTSLLLVVLAVATMVGAVVALAAEGRQVVSPLLRQVIP
jgi:hypothetical protein